MAKINAKFEHQAQKNKKVEKMIENNAKAFNKKNKKNNQKSLRRMKLHKSAPELAQGIQQLYLRAQDP